MKYLLLMPLTEEELRLFEQRAKFYEWEPILKYI